MCRLLAFMGILVLFQKARIAEVRNFLQGHTIAWLSASANMRVQMSSASLRRLGRLASILGVKQEIAEGNEVFLGLMIATFLAGRQYQTRVFIFPISTLINIESSWGHEALANTFRCQMHACVRAQECVCV